MAALESLVPQDMEAHLQMNASKFDTYEKMRNEVVAYLETRTGARMRDARITKHDASRDAMDVDSMTKGYGKGSGGAEPHPHGGSARFQGQCHVCGNTGHKAADCWQAAADWWGPAKGKKSDAGKSITSGTSKG